ncbi:MAG: 16S rRNA (guanine(527)-N(7))-methyltransferase RsmG [Rickettsia endosymbiont of Pseudomimeciton antennatum]|nr:16S rRNA (guanine(527)-N(7))-methyltransferase RsmG [Rickettsia endosymbiont of Pseudomimeciton antennatum]MCC8398848.1 16S rRNA (guanine(527)-N(7))-methyltransferase RsmG [Rickettsia endosymbiont of Labidopullus appendiculatus]
MYDCHNVPREILDALEKYQSLTLKWNKTINLVSCNTECDFWVRHILDSLQLMKYINDQNVHLIDVGSGGGFPGIVLSIAGIKNVTLVESDMRKSIFLLQASKISSNKVNVINQRIEAIKLDCDILTSRACAQLEKIFVYTKHINVRNKYLLFKGKQYQKEIEIAKKRWSFCHSIYDSETSNNSKILEISNIYDKNSCDS